MPPAGAGAHLGHVFWTPGLLLPEHIAGVLAWTLTALPPPAGTTNTSACGCWYMSLDAPVRLNAMSVSSGENAGKYSLYDESDAPCRPAAVPPACPVSGTILM